MQGSSMSKQGQQPPEQDEFDRLFALDDDQPAPAAPTNTPDPAAPAPAAAPEGTTDDHAGGGAPAGAGEGTGEPAPSQPEPTDDWRAALPEDVRKRIDEEIAKREQAAKEAEDRYKALHGRLAPVQQRLSEAERQLAALQQSRTPAITQPAARPAAPDATQTLDSYFDSAEWKAYEHDFPADAKVLRSGLELQYRAQQQVIARLDEQINQLAQRLERTEVVVTDTSLSKAIEQLDARHPDWRDLNESDSFWEWFESWRAEQPKALRGLYYDDTKLGELFTDPDWVSDVLDRYKAQHATGRAPPTAQPAAPAAAPAAPTVTPQPESAHPAPAQTAVNPRLSMSVAPEVRGQGVVPAAIPLDQLTPEQQFEHLWRNEQ